MVLLENQSLQRPATSQAPDSGSELATLARIDYEELLQTSCLGKNSIGFLGRATEIVEKNISFTVSVRKSV